MKIGGLQKISLLDYPNTLSAIIWAIDCNFRCPFCYNKNLVLGKVKLIPEADVLSFLEKRIGLLEGVVISGGEPLLQKKLVGFTRNIKNLGYLIKIDTNGTFPKRLQELFDQNLIDYVSMDVKAPQKKYDQLTGVKTNLSQIEQSIKIIQDHAPDYEFKTTFVPELLKQEDIIEIANWLKGSKRFYLQQFKNNPPLLSSRFEQVSPYPKQYLIDTINLIKSYFPTCELRGV